MLLFLTQLFFSLLNRLIYWLEWDISNANLQGKTPISVAVVACALTGAILAGFIGAVIGGLAGLILHRVISSKAVVPPTDVIITYY